MTRTTGANPQLAPNGGQQKAGADDSHPPRPSLWRRFARNYIGRYTASPVCALTVTASVNSI